MIKLPDFPLLILFLLLSLIGVALLPFVPVQLKPNTIKPAITIGFSWRNASPRAIEQEVTSILEGAFNTVKGISGICSESYIGLKRIHFQEDKKLEESNSEPETLNPKL